MGCTDGPTLTPASDVAGAFNTDGCSGADGFFRCDVTNTADADVAPIVSAVATAFMRKSRIASDRDWRSKE